MGRLAFGGPQHHGWAETFDEANVAVERNWQARRGQAALIVAGRLRQ
jgi:hypothetical protein